MIDEILDWLDEHPIISGGLIVGSIIGAYSLYEASKVDYDSRDLLETATTRLNLDVINSPDAGEDDCELFCEHYGIDSRTSRKRDQIQLDVISAVSGEKPERAILLMAPYQTGNDSVYTTTIGVLNLKDAEDPIEFLKGALPGRFISGNLHGRVTNDGWGFTLHD